MVSWKNEGLLLEGVTARTGAWTWPRRWTSPGRGPRPWSCSPWPSGGCTGMDVISILQKMRQPLEGLRVEVQRRESRRTPQALPLPRGRLPPEGRPGREEGAARHRTVRDQVLLGGGHAEARREHLLAVRHRALRPRTPTGSRFSRFTLQAPCLQVKRCLYYLTQTTARREVRGPRSRAVGSAGRRYPVPHLPGIAERPGEDVTVAEIAARFGLHPNVARMHLAKLEQAGFLATDFRRTSGGGRPAKLYRLSDSWSRSASRRGATSCSPGWRSKRSRAGGSRDDAVRVCREAGRRGGRAVRRRRPARRRDAAAAAELVRRIAEEQGLLPEVTWRDEASRSSSTTAPSVSSRAPTRTSCAPCIAPSWRACSRS